MNVIKRNGESIEFDKNKIKIAIEKANSKIQDHISDEQINQIVNNIETEILRENREDINVEEIQELVENELIHTENTEIIKEFIRFRYKRNIEREDQNLKTRLFATNVQNQNANMDEKSFGGRIGEAASYITKEYALDNCMCKKSKRNHLNNEIYIHK